MRQDGGSRGGRTRRRFLASASTLALVASLPARAAGFPDRPIRLLFPAQPGGAGDPAMRSVCAIASRELGCPVVIDYRPGVAGTLPARALTTARPDGYTLAVMPATVFRVPLLTPSLAGFDPRTDFDWILQLAGLLVGVVVRADSPWSTFADVLDAARRSPGAISIGVPGRNTTELPLQILAKDQGIEWTPVEFRAGPEALQALLGGHIQAIADTSSWIPHVLSGELRLLATLGEQRSARFPEVPTLSEFGAVPAMDFASGIAAPRGLPPEIGVTLHDAFRTALFAPATLDLLRLYDMSVRYLGSADYAAEASRLYELERDVLRRLHLLPP